MKLNKYTKEGIVHAIMADLPTRDDSALEAELQAKAIAAMSPEVLAVYNTRPKALLTEYVYSASQRRGFHIIVGDVGDEAFESFYEAEKARESARSNLSGAIMSCNTLKQLQAMFPEFIKYMPTEAEPTKNLPALANVVADLVKMGWPKGA